jgi:hypothetical protein
MNPISKNAYHLMGDLALSLYDPTVYTQTIRIEE